MQSLSEPATKRILSVKIVRELDSQPDTSWIGSYSSKPGPDDRTIDRQERGDMGRHEFRYFVAALSGEEAGNPDSVEQAYKRMETLGRGDWNLLGVWVEAEIVVCGVVQRIRSGGLWGIESDSDDYHRDVEREQLHELADELRAFGFDDDAIKAAFAMLEGGAAHAEALACEVMARFGSEVPS